MRILENLRQVIVFSLDNEDYGIDVENICEVNRLKEINIVEFPKAPDFIEGIINLRGEVVPIVDMRKRLKMPAKERDRHSRIIITKIEKKTVGFVVDKVIKAAEFLPQEISTSTDEITQNGKYIKAIAKKDSEIIVILDVKEIINNTEDR